MPDEAGSSQAVNQQIELMASDMFSNMVPMVSWTTNTAAANTLGIVSLQLYCKVKILLGPNSQEAAFRLLLGVTVLSPLTH